MLEIQSQMTANVSEFDTITIC